MRWLFLRNRIIGATKVFVLDQPPKGYWIDNSTNTVDDEGGSGLSIFPQGFMAQGHIHVHPMGDIGKFFL